MLTLEGMFCPYPPLFFLPTSHHLPLPTSLPLLPLHSPYHHQASALPCSHHLHYPPLPLCHHLSKLALLCSPSLHLTYLKLPIYILQSLHILWHQLQTMAVHCGPHYHHYHHHHQCHCLVWYPHPMGNLTLTLPQIVGRCLWNTLSPIK